MYVKTDSQILLKCMSQFSAQPSTFPGTMKNSIFAYLTMKYKYLKSVFCTIIKILVLTTEWTQRRDRFVLKSVDSGRFMTSEGNETLVLAFTSKTG